MDTRELYNTFLTLYGINLVHRFPTEQLDRVTDDSILESVGQFCIRTSRIASNVWFNFMEQEQRRQAPRQTTRVA